MKTKFELLSNIDLEYYAYVFKVPLREVLNKDLFASKSPKQGCYIVNLESSTVGPGTHWTGLIITEKLAVYWDPFGLPPPRSIIRFIKKSPNNLRMIYSTDQIQELNSNFCGWFVLYFLYFFP
jgi:hypothetical protein